MNDTARRQLALQGGTFLAMLALVAPYFLIHGTPMPWAAIAAATGGCSGLIAWFSRSPWWWVVIHAIFAPLVWLAQQTTIAPSWYLGALALTYLASRGALIDRVPLFLSNRDAVAAFADWLPANENVSLKVADLGAGIGSFLLPLARRRPDLRLLGIENAPIAWTTGYLRVRRQPRIQWCYGSFWSFNLADTDVVYAYLSPEPMSKLWDKLSAELRPGAYLVSNSFEVPGVEPAQIIPYGEGGTRSLLIYRIPL